MRSQRRCREKHDRQKKGGGGVKAGHVGDKQDESGVKVRKAGLMAYIMGQIRGEGQ